MKISKYLLWGALALGVLLGLIGFALPATYQVERSIEINAPMETVYPLVYDPKAWARWSVWSRRDPGMTITYSGAPAGVGAKWSWQSRSEGSGSMEFTGADFNRRVAYKVALADFDSVLSGRFEFAPAGKGVRVNWVAEGDVGANPLMRYIAIAMDRLQGPDFETGLANLKQLAEKLQ